MQCDACDNGGKAKVVKFYTKENNKLRFFFGCDKSTLEVPCRGSKAWQTFQVPDEVIREEGYGDLLDEESEKKTKKGKAKDVKGKTGTRVKLELEVDGLKQKGGMKVVVSLEGGKKKKARDDDDFDPDIKHEFT